MAAAAATDPSLLPLHGRVAIVTGASRGIGRAIASHLASLGANLVLGYATNSTQADLLASEIAAQHPSSTAVPFRVDVSVAAETKSLFDFAEKTFGTSAHIVVNSAGVLDPTYPALADTTDASFDATFGVNARGAFLCIREAANRVVRGGGGRIVALSSSLVGALRPGYGAYAASKAAVEAMVKVLAKELKGTMITVNCVAPGPIATDMFFDGKSEEMVRMIADQSPLNRLGTPEDVARLVGFLASDASELINGQVIRINGGYV